MATNEFLEFCEDDNGTNLLTQNQYDLSTDRTSGNKPGIASSRLVNKALRQSSFITSQLAQYMSNKTATDLLDDGNEPKFLAQLAATIQPLPPTYTNHLTGSGTHNATFYFFIAAGSATVGATYTNNGTTYTIAATVAAGSLVSAKGNAYPLDSGTLTKTGGTGDATLTFYSVRAPIYYNIKMVGGGAGGAGSGTAGGSNGGNGVASTFGTSLLVASFGGAGQQNDTGGFGGSASLGTGPTGVALLGGSGGGPASPSGGCGGIGGSSAYGGGGASGGGSNARAGTAGAPNTGGGGGGANFVGTGFAGGGGGSGGYISASIYSGSVAFAYSYPWAVGAGGAFGPATSGGSNGGAGGSGIIEVMEHYQ